MLVHHMSFPSLPATWIVSRQSIIFNLSPPEALLLIAGRLSRPSRKRLSSLSGQWPSRCRHPRGVSRPSCYRLCPPCSRYAGQGPGAGMVGLALHSASSCHTRSHRTCYTACACWRRSRRSVDVRYPGLGSVPNCCNSRQ